MQDSELLDIISSANQFAAEVASLSAACIALKIKLDHATTQVADLKEALKKANEEKLELVRRNIELQVKLNPPRST